MRVAPERRMAAANKFRWLGMSLAVTIPLLIAVPALSGAYRDSAHGNAAFGVSRAAIDGRYAEYATGNCAHCHEAHASLGGVEPAPAVGPAPHTLFAAGFNATRTLNLYVESDDFCFYCHGGIGQQVMNQDYSASFGGATTGSGPQSIMSAFNQASYHNLYDISNFLSTNPTYSAWFAKLGNPCSACHNSHLAKRNWSGAQPGFPLLSAISKPGDHASLWGESQLMTAYVAYEAPYALGQSREPAGVGDPDGGNTADYVAFCTSCHNAGNAIWSTTLNRELKKIDWGATGLILNKHGSLGRDGTSSFREPYAAAAALKSNFVLSCLDCHEAHGSENIMLLRRRVNGENLEGAIASTDAMSYVCKRCHTDDLAADTATHEANRWEYVHHRAADAPYERRDCADCHGIDVSDPPPIPCGNCHGHGMDDSWAGARATGRKTF